MINIKEIIKENKLTIQQFADSIYVSRRTVHNWLSGNAVPRQKQKQIQDVYGKRELPTSQGEVDTD